MSDEAPGVDDDGAWGEPVPEAAFEDALVEEPAPMDTGLGGGLEIAADLGDAVGELAADVEPNLRLPIDVALLLDVLAQLDDRVPYVLGGKPSKLTLTTEQFLAERKAGGVDCSGFIRWLLYRASGGKLKIRDGTFGQRDDFRALADAVHLPASPYADCERDDGVLRVAGFVKSPKIGFGHIWIVHNGLSGESRGHHGIDRRPWNTEHLITFATWCYPIARLP